MDEKRIDAIHRARARQADAARPEAVRAVHANGRLTARERIELLLDVGSAVEYGSIAALAPDSGEWVAETGGLDYIGAVDGQTLIASSTDYTDHGGGYGAGKLTHLFGLAHEHRWPVVMFVDGGGSRARHPRAGMGHIEIGGAIGPFSLFDGIAELSGWVPTIAVVSGPSYAGHASLAAFCDFLIGTRGSSIGMGGPPMVEAALGIRVTPNELAPVEMHDVRGGIDLLVDDEPAAIDAVKRYLAFYRDADAGEPSSTHTEIANLVPDEGPYDVLPVIEALADEGSVFQLRPNFARSLVTALARLDGRSVGIAANQPLVDDGALTEDAAAKLARFVEICDAYEYPLISLIDTPGFVTRWEEEGDSASIERSMVRAHARPLMSQHHRTAPIFSVQIRRGGGLGTFAMGGFANGHSVSVMRLAWPGVELQHRDGFSAFENGHTFDDVIDPRETRARISGVLRHLPRRLSREEKKHPIDTA